MGRKCLSENVIFKLMSNKSQLCHEQRQHVLSRGPSLFGGNESDIQNRKMGNEAE